MHAIKAFVSAYMYPIITVCDVKYVHPYLMSFDTGQIAMKMILKMSTISLNHMPYR